MCGVHPLCIQDGKEIEMVGLGIALVVCSVLLFLIIRDLHSDLKV